MISIVKADGSIKGVLEVIEVKDEESLISELVDMMECNSIRTFGYCIDDDTEDITKGLKEADYHKFIYKLGDKYIGCSFGKYEGNGLINGLLLYNNYIDKEFEKYAKQIFDIMSERYNVPLMFNVSYGGHYGIFNSNERERLLKGLGAELSSKRYIYKRDDN